MLSDHPGAFSSIDSGGQVHAVARITRRELGRLIEVAKTKGQSILPTIGLHGLSPLTAAQATRLATHVKPSCRADPGEAAHIVINDVAKYTRNTLLGCGWAVARKVIPSTEDVMMDERFVAHVESLRPTFQRLLAMPPVTYMSLPRSMSRSGIYLFSDGDHHLYVGRSNDIRKRLGRHCRPSAHASMASFAFQLARETTGQLEANYRRGTGGTREELMQNELFRQAFLDAKIRIRGSLSIRFVEEADPTRQALLEIYAAVVLATPYNNFDTH